MPPLPIGQSPASGATFAISPDDRDNHMAIFGSTGVGKSTLMLNMIAADIVNGAGLTVLDPHGSLIEDILQRIPAARADDVIYLRPGVADQPIVGVNLMDVQAQQHHLAVSSLVNIFRNLWPDAWGPRSEFILTNMAQAVLLSGGKRTIITLQKLLTDRSYRLQLAGRITDPAVSWFFDYFDRQWSKSDRDEYAAPLINKVNAFVRNKVLRLVVGQHHSAFSFRQLLDEGKILLCDLADGRIGPDITPVIGSIVAAKLFLAALSREDIAEAQRRPHYLYMDEFQSFTHGVDLPTILAEVRKFGLRIICGTQTVSLLPRDTQAAIFGNCNTVASFRVSSQDAEILVKESASGLPARELQTLSRYELYLKTIQDGAPAGPHLLKTFPPSPKTGREASKEHVIRTSLQRYGARPQQIEAAIKPHLTPAPAPAK